jgi:hypothetical protein
MNMASAGRGISGRVMKSWKQYWVYCVSGGVPRRSLIVSVVVGTILNLINQGDALFGAAPVSIAKIVLTYIVPYVVATYGAVSYRMSLARMEARGGS